MHARTATPRTIYLFHVDQEDDRCFHSYQTLLLSLTMDEVEEEDYPPLPLHEVDPQTLDRDYFESLHNVALDGDLEAMKRLIRQGCNVNEYREAGHHTTLTPLHLACLNNDLKMAKLLLGKGGADPNTAGADFTASRVLHLASLKGHHEFARLLLEGGADIDAGVDPTSDSACWTALHLACKQGHILVVKLLLDYKADVNLTNEGEHGDTPLTIACDPPRNSFDVELALLIVQQDDVNINVPRKDGMGPLHLCPSPRLGQALLDKGARVNALDNMRSIPLHDACREGNFKMVEFLIGHKAKVNARDHNGMTPLHYAVTSESFDIAQLLIAKKAHINSRDIEKNTPLHLSCLEFGVPDIAQLLLQNGALVNPRTYKGSTPLHFACGHSRHPVIVKSLLDHQAKVRVQDKNGECPLHAAAHDFELSNSLMKVDPACRLILDSQGRLPFHLCTQAETSRLLIETESYDCENEKGPEPADCWMAHEVLFARNPDGCTALDLCTKNLAWLEANDGHRYDIADATKNFEYLRSFEEPLAVCSSDSTTRKRKRNASRGLAVKLNPKLNGYQEHLAEQMLKLVSETPAHPVKYGVLGFLSAADVMKRQPPQV